MVTAQVTDGEMGFRGAYVFFISNWIEWPSQGQGLGADSVSPSLPLT